MSVNELPRLNYHSSPGVPFFKEIDGWIGRCKPFLVDIFTAYQTNLFPLCQSLEKNESIRGIYKTVSDCVFVELRKEGDMYYPVNICTDRNGVMSIWGIHSFEERDLYLSKYFAMLKEISPNEVQDNYSVLNTLYSYCGWFAHKIDLREAEALLFDNVRYDERVLYRTKKMMKNYENIYVYQNGGFFATRFRGDAHFIKRISEMAEKMEKCKP